MKKILKKISFVAVAGVLLSMQSCGDWLDVNTNDLAATKVEPGYLFNYAAVNYSGTRMGGDQYMSIIWPTQVVSDGNYWYGGDDLYQVSEYSTGNTWVSTYSSVGNNLIKAIEFAKVQDDENAVAQCEIFLALSVWGSTMIFGDIPYSEAWKIETIKTPKFDAQKDILYALIDKLDAAIASIDVSKKSSISEFDIYYKGDMAQWLKLGKALKLRILLTLANKEDVGSKIKSLVEENQMLASSADALVFPYYDSPGNYNPNYALFAVYPNIMPLSYAANPTVMDPMKAVNDPRLPLYFEATESDPTKYAAIPAGADYFDGYTSIDPNDPEAELLDVSTINLKYYSQKTTPDVLLSYSENQHNIAEVYVRGLGVAKDKAKANEHYRNAIKASCVFAGVKEADAATFVAELPSLATMSDQQALEAIASQQRIDMMNSPLEAWATQRRMDFPKLTIPASIKGENYPGVMQRWPYPSREILVNNNAPKVEIWDKMWFQN